MLLFIDRIIFKFCKAIITADLIDLVIEQQWLVLRYVVLTDKKLNVDKGQKFLVISWDDLHKDIVIMESAVGNISDTELVFLHSVSVYFLSIYIVINNICMHEYMEHFQCVQKFQIEIANLKSLYIMRGQ